MAPGRRILRRQKGNMLSGREKSRGAGILD